MLKSCRNTSYKHIYMTYTYDIGLKYVTLRQKLRVNKRLIQSIITCKQIKYMTKIHVLNIKKDQNKYDTHTKLYIKYIIKIQIRY